MAIMNAILTRFVLAQAQSPQSPPAQYGEVTFVKVHSGMNDNYLASLTWMKHSRIQRAKLILLQNLKKCNQKMIIRLFVQSKLPFVNCIVRVYEN